MSEPVKLYLAQFRENATATWRNAGEWCGSEAEAGLDLQLRAPKGLEYRVLAIAAEALEVVAPAVPTVERVEPATAMVGGPDVTVHVHGTGFDVTSRIVWNGSEEPTVYVSPAELTTVCKPSTASGPVTVPVGVTGAAETVAFTFTAAA